MQSACREEVLSEMLRDMQTILSLFGVLPEVCRKRQVCKCGGPIFVWKDLPLGVNSLRRFSIPTGDSLDAIAFEGGWK